MILELNNLGCGYNLRPIVSGINETLQSGEILCILGENGVGKSTLFKTILKLIPPVEGRITIDGADISDWSHQKLAGKMAYHKIYKNCHFA